MAQQILSAIDLRTEDERRGVNRTLQNLSSILQTLKQAEKTRREREDLDTISRAVASGTDITEAINAVVQQKREFAPGFQGILQRIGGAGIQGGVGQDLQRAIVGQKLTQALKPQLLTQEEKVKGAKIKAGLLPRAGVVKPKKRKGFSLTELKTLTTTIPTAQTTINDRIEKTAIEGINKRSQADLAQAYKETAIELGYETWTEDQRKQFDLKWDRQARAKWKPKKAISKETGKQIDIGWNPNSPEVKAARQELRQQTTTQAPTGAEEVAGGAEDVLKKFGI